MYSVLFLYFSTYEYLHQPAPLGYDEIYVYIVIYLEILSIQLYHYITMLFYHMYRMGFLFCFYCIYYILYHVRSVLTSKRRYRYIFIYMYMMTLWRGNFPHYWPFVLGSADHQSPVDSLYQRPLKRGLVTMNKLLNKQLNFQSFATPCCSCAQTQNGTYLMKLILRDLTNCEWNNFVHSYFT